MQYQVFRGNDVNEALALVRAAYGNEAVIASTRRVPRSRGALGPALVEVTAAPAPMEAEAFAPAGARQRPRTANSLVMARAPASSQRAAGNAIEKEIALLRTLVNDLARERKPRDRAEGMLHAAGIEGALASVLCQGLDEAGIDDRSALEAWLRERIADTLLTKNDLLEQPGPRVITCVGPTGAGKTTTLAKLAARARLEYGRSVAVITLDNVRVGAVAQWQRYASLLGMPLAVAHDAESFTRGFVDQHADIVLVDTAGRSAKHEWRDERLVECLNELHGVPVDVLMVLPAWLRSGDVERVMALYSEPRPTSLVITKTDEAGSAGGALQAAIGHALSVAYLCNGPQVPEDIHVADPDRVLDAIFPQR